MINKRGRRPMNEEWDTKLYSMRKEFDSKNSINWGAVLRETPFVFTNIVGGVAKATVSEKRKLGIEVDRSLESIYAPVLSEHCFVDSLEVLWGQRTIAEMSELTGISQAIIRSLKLGLRAPTFEEMRTIADAFKIQPEFFLEYRIATILASLDQYLMASPEIATAWFKKVEQTKGLSI